MPAALALPTIPDTVLSDIARLWLIEASSEVALFTAMMPNALTSDAIPETRFPAIVTCWP